MPAAAPPPRYDHIVVGGGTAGAIVAARLSEDPDRRVLLLEAGADYPRELPAALQDVSAAVLTGHNWDFQAILREAGADRVVSSSAEERIARVFQIAGGATAAESRASIASDLAQLLSRDGDGLPEACHTSTPLIPRQDRDDPEPRRRVSVTGSPTRLGCRKVTLRSAPRHRGTRLRATAARCRTTSPRCPVIQDATPSPMPRRPRS